MIGPPPLMSYFLGPQMCSFNKDGGPGPYWRKILADKDEGELSKCRESLPLADGVSSPFVALRIESMEGDQAAEVALVLLALGQEVGRKSMWVCCFFEDV